MLGSTDRNELSEFIDDFLPEMTALVASIERALEAGDLKTLQIAAHTLKSNSATLGGMQVHAASKAIEDLAKREDVDALAALVRALPDTYRSFLEGLERERATW